MSYRKRSGDVEAKQWFPPGDERHDPSMLRGQGGTVGDIWQYGLSGDYLFRQQSGVATVLDTGDWVVIANERVDLYADAIFKDQFVDNNDLEVTWEYSESKELRDYLASQADSREMFGDEMPWSMAEILNTKPKVAYEDDPIGYLKWWADALAAWKYMMADAMLARRTANASR